MKTKYDDLKKFMVGSPLAAKKHHLYYDGADVGVCGKWWFTGEKYPVSEKYPFGSDKEDCALCAKKYLKAQEEAVVKMVKERLTPKVVQS